jgi:hypothetical protein
MTTRIRPRPALLLALTVLTLTDLGAATPDGARTEPFPVAQLFFELNHSDGDLGIHAEIDGGAWTSLEIEGPGDRALLSLVGKGRLRQQGLTQLAFESAEPSFDELDPADFFARFPEGIYDIEARRQGGGTFESEVRLSHVLAAPPGHITLNGVPAAENCDATPLPEVVAPVQVRWDPVTTSHPEIGKSGPVQISRYQFFVEYVTGKLSIDLAPTQTGYLVPFTDADRGRVFKFEIIARTATGNNTAVESCFTLR